MRRARAGNETAPSFERQGNKATANALLQTVRARRDPNLPIDEPTLDFLDLDRNRRERPSSFVAPDYQRQPKNASQEKSFHVR